MVEAISAQQAQFQAVTAALGDAKQGQQSALSKLQGQTEQLQRQLAAMATDAASALESTATAAASGFRVRTMYVLS